jgi:arylsulfatase A-like enzyme
MKKALAVIWILSAAGLQAATVTYDFNSGLAGSVSGNLSAGDVSFTLGSNSDDGGSAALGELGWYDGDTSGDHSFMIGARASNNQGILDANLNMLVGAPSYISFTLTPGAGESLDFSSATLDLDAVLYRDNTTSFSMVYKIWADSGSGWVALGSLQSFSSTGTGTGSLFETDESTALSPGTTMTAGAIGATTSTLNYDITSLGIPGVDQAVTVAIALSGNRDAQWNFGSAVDDIVVALPAIVGGNTAPVTTNNVYGVMENGTLNVSAPGVLGNDGDADGDTIYAQWVSDPANGSLTLNTNGSFIYTPDTDFSGADSFTYSAHDGSVAGNVATVSITVTNLPAVPVGLDDAYSVVRGNELNIAEPGVLMNDEDNNGDVLSVLLISDVSSGSLTLNSNGSFDYIPAIGYTGTVSFSYAPVDGSFTGNTAIVDIQVLEPIAVERPNILIFFCDDMGIGDSRIYNTSSNLPPAMPTIENFATNGIVFNDAHTQAALCAPSRYSILTGNYPWRGRLEGGSWHMNKGAQVMPGQRTIAHVLNSAGYHTSIFGKGHLGGYLTDTNGVNDTRQIVWKDKNNNGINDAQDYVDGTSGDQAVLQADYYDPSKTDWSLPVSNGVCSALVGFDYGYMLYGGIQDPLYAYFENDYFVGDPSQLEVWANRDNDYATANGRHWTYRPGYGLHGWYTCDVGPSLTQRTLDFIDDHVATNQVNGTDDPFFIHYCAEAVHSKHTPPTNFLGTAVAGTTGYAHSDMLFELEVAFSNIIHKLETKGLLDDTLVIFTSDNGGLSLGEASSGHNPNEGLRSHKASIWEGGHRVPMFIKWGDRIPAGSYDPMVGVHDLYATIAQLVGKQQGEGQGLDAVSLLSVLLSGNKAPVRDNLLMRGNHDVNNSDPDHFLGRALREGSYKMIWDKDNNIPLFLYNLATDPTESVDLLNSPAQVQRVARMTAKMNDFVAEISDPNRYLSGRSEPLPPLRDLNENGMDDDWEVTYFGSTNAVDGGPLDDYEPDGINNLLEFAFGSNPTVADDPAAVLPDFEISGDTFEYVYRRRQDAAARNLQYASEQSDNLLSNHWNSAGLTEVGSEFISADIESVTNHYSMTGTTNRFFRLKVTSP